MPLFGATVEKHPDAVLPYGFDWTSWLTANGSTAIVTSTWENDDPNSSLTFSNDSILPGEVQTGVIISGGVVTPYKVMVRNHVIDDAGYEDEKHFYLVVKQDAMQMFTT